MSATACRTGLLAAAGLFLVLQGAFSASGDGGKSSVDYLLELSPQELRDLIPERKPIRTYMESTAFPARGPAQWNPRKPREIIVDDESFVPEERFPADRILTLEGPRGKKFSYEYYLTKDGNPVYPTSHTDQAARDFFVRAAIILAKRYRDSGDKEAAFTAAVILQRLAEIYPDYPRYGRLWDRHTWAVPENDDFPDTTAKWQDWYYQLDMLDIGRLAEAYGFIRDSGVVEKLSRELKVDVRAQIEEGFFLDAVALALAYDKGLEKKTGHLPMDNLQPSKYEGFQRIGRALQRPDLVHAAVRGLRRILKTEFMADGAFKESPAYHYTTLRGIRKSMEELEGYSDPPGYLDRVTGKRFDKFNAERDLPFLARTIRFYDEARFPDGRLMPVHDSFLHENGPPPPTKARSLLWPAFGHGFLGTGEGSDQAQLHLHYSGSYGHEHQDMLNMIFYAQGEELLSDIGDARFTYRGWATSTLAHNTVVVDGASQPYSGYSKNPQPGNLLAWFPVREGFGAIEAEGRSAYLQTDRYLRSLMLVEVAPGRTLALDIFEVAGGHQHDWMVHGSADQDQKLVVNREIVPWGDSLALNGKVLIPRTAKELSGTNIIVEIDNEAGSSPYWGVIRDVGKVKGPGPWQATFKGIAPGSASLRLHLLSPTKAEIFTGVAPSLRRAGVTEEEAGTFFMPVLVARCSGEELQSRYIAVWEPFREAAWVESTEIVSYTSEGVMLRLRGDGFDIYLGWGVSDESVVKGGPFRFTGRFFCARKSGTKWQVDLAEVREVAFNDHVWSAPVDVTLVLEKAGNDGDTDFAVLSGKPTGEWGILRFANGVSRGVRFGKWEDMPEGRCRVSFPDGLGLAGSEKGGWKETHFPARKFAGRAEIVVPSRASVTFDESLESWETAK